MTEDREAIVRVILCAQEESIAVMKLGELLCDMTTPRRASSRRWRLGRRANVFRKRPLFARERAHRDGNTKKQVTMLYEMIGVVCWPCEGDAGEEGVLTMAGTARPSH
jgi:hypothetical protein